MIDHPVLKIVCWIAAAIALFGGINYFFIAQNKDLVPKISSSSSGRKALYYTVGVATLVLLVLKVLHHYNHQAVSYYY